MLLASISRACLVLLLCPLIANAAMGRYEHGK
jgi:hypothetical protein